MNFSQLKASVADWLNRSDLTAQIPDFINMALHDLERDWNYRCMEKRESISITDTGSADDAYISLPTNYKETKWMKILYDNSYYDLERDSEDKLLSDYPDLVNDRGMPEKYGVVRYTNEFLLRPSQDTTYTLDATHYVYTADLSADADTNWWTTNAWECLLFGALVFAAKFLMDDTKLQLWIQYYKNAVTDLRNAETKEAISGSAPQNKSAYVV